MPGLRRRGSSRSGSSPGCAAADDPPRPQGAGPRAGAAPTALRNATRCRLPAGECKRSRARPGVAPSHSATEAPKRHARIRQTATAESANHGWRYRALHIRRRLRQRTTPYPRGRANGPAAAGPGAVADRGQSGGGGAGNFQTSSCPTSGHGWRRSSGNVRRRRRAILDELAGQAHNPARRTAIGNPLAYARTLTQRALAGAFIPEAALRVAAARETAPRRRTGATARTRGPAARRRLRRRIRGNARRPRPCVPSVSPASGRCWRHGAIRQDCGHERFGTALSPGTVRVPGGQVARAASPRSGVRCARPH